MWPYYPELLATPVPRYTSYPTAVEFSTKVGLVELDAAICAAEGDVSLYVHIPFCEQICWYCGCNTSAANKRERVESYLDTLHREIALAGAKLGRKAQVRRIAFGGGSPNAIRPTDFVRLADALTIHFALENPSWSIEIDPRKLTDDWIPVLKTVGVTMASLGVQTFSPELQKAIGRVQPDAEIVKATDQLRRAGITSLNFDLMYGLPGQTLGDVEASLARSAELGADRIALFGYAHVPHIIPRQKRIDATNLPDQAARFEMAAFGYDFLTAKGYVPIGFDHFALPSDPMAQAAQAGRLHRNFQGFTEDKAPTLIGLGATAISCFPDLIIQNEKNAGRYHMLLSQDRLSGTLGVVRAAEDRMRGAVIESLLCHGKATVPAALRNQIGAALGPFETRGLARLKGATLEITPDGLPYARTIAALFDGYRQDSVRKFSSAV